MRILSVSYDSALLATRELLLQMAGYDVVSADSFTEAFDRASTADFDLAIIGHSIPHRDKLVLIEEIRAHGDAAVLALLRPGEPAMSAGIKTLLALEGPEQLLETVEKIAASKRKLSGSAPARPARTSARPKTRRRS